MVAAIKQRTGGTRLAGRTLYIPQMSYAGARMMAAAFRSVGVNAAPSPDSDAETLELGGLYSSGEECLPHKVTLGDFLKVCRAPGFDAGKVAFFMPTAHGPCRFGQYAPYLRKTLAELGYGDVPVISPTSRNGYDGIGDQASDLMRTAWMGVVVGDIITKFLLKTRPYEKVAGDADEAFEQSITAFCGILELPRMEVKERLGRLVAAAKRMRDRFRAVPARYAKGRPLIGLVGEIFCRLNTFSNDDAARRIEQHGGECWMSDIAEWVWYTNWSQEDTVRRECGRFTKDFLKLKIKTHIQRRYEHTLLAPVVEDLRGYEEPHDIRELLAASQPYLPPQGCLGEMVLSVGKSIYLYEKGADGIIDISPFTCMNGIICEAVYPAVSQAHDDLPMRTFYFDGVNTNLDRDLEIFLDLARAYQARKKKPRGYPRHFS
jgi:predicted nucleotide-binding protein (sugar kinase/HSP70/actin superfamily)